MITQTSTREEFAALLEESFATHDVLEGTVVKGTITAIEKDLAVIDIGLKTEGRIPLKEFGKKAKDNGMKPGDIVEVYLDRVENALGEAVLSREKARHEEGWNNLEKIFEKDGKVEGFIFSQVKGGFKVDLDGAIAFLPRSQVDIRPIRDVAPLMNVSQPFQILKMDRRRGNIVVSRRMILEESRAEQRSEIVQKLEEGQVAEGVVKNVTDYGAFIDLGGIDGLLHVTDMSWRRINHPDEILKIGENVKVQVTRINHETQRISLGMKQLQTDPWENIEEKYPIGKKVTGRITNVTDYGAFVEIEAGIEGLIHISEMSWTKKNIHPGKIVATSQEVEIVVLDIDSSKRRISLGLKQTLDNPWKTFAEKYAVSSVIEGEVKNKTDFALFIGLEGEVDGMVHLSDLDWNRPGEEVLKEYNRGDTIKVAVLEVDVEKERISLGVKQVSGEDPIAAGSDSGLLRKGSVVTCEVVAIKDSGIDVKIADLEIPTFIKRSDLSRDRDEQRPERFSCGQRVDARITQFDKKNRRVTVSIKALEIAEEKEAVAQYGSNIAGASLGDILSAALKDREEENK